MSDDTTIDARTKHLLEAPVFPTLLRLAAPNVGEAAARVAFISLDAVFVSWVGTDALAGIAVVFPLFLMMQTISAGGLGVGVASAIARALGGGRKDEAAAVAGNTVILVILLSAFSSAALLFGGPWLYRSIGLTGAALDAAIVYSAIVFGGAISVWTMNLLANIIRGTGNMKVPASAIVVGEIAHVIVSPVLILGLGPFPAMGITGAAIGIVATYTLGAAILIAYLLSSKGLLTLRLQDLRWRTASMQSILGVGAPAALNALQFQLTIVVLSSYAAIFGTAATAGLGTALRLELLQVPIVFAFGSAIVTMVATTTGAGNLQRARKITLAGCATAAVIGLLFASVAVGLPAQWLGLFTSDADVVAYGASYLSVVGPAYPVFTASLALFFAAQGAGYGFGPFLASSLRLLVVAGGGWLAVNLLDGAIDSLFVVTAAALIISSIGILIASRAVLWPPRPTPTAAAAAVRR